MITRIEGKLVERELNAVIVDVQGIGYSVEVSTRTAELASSVGERILLHTHLILRDDGVSLYGFTSKEERQLFLLLLGVQSVGPKVALAVLGGGTLEEISAAVLQGDGKLFQAVPGVGKRTAERILLELQAKIGDLASGAGSSVTSTTEMTKTSVQGIAQDGLLQLGFSASEASAMLKGIQADTPEALIAAALRNRHKK